MGEIVKRFGRLLLRSVQLLPYAVAALVLTAVGRRRQADELLLGSAPADNAAASAGRTVAVAVLVLPLGLLSFLVALLATLNEVRVVLLYWLTDGRDGSIDDGTWGGPTLAGAWAVHAVLGLILFPVFVAVLAGLVRLADLLGRNLLTSEKTPNWVLPAVVVADLAAVAFLVAFVKQL